MNEKSKDVLGPGLGPDWAANLPIKGLHEVRKPSDWSRLVGIIASWVPFFSKNGIFKSNTSVK